MGAYLRKQDPQEIIPLHEPRFSGNESKYIHEFIDSKYLSSVGNFVDYFEKKKMNH